jgi:putative ABC transport system ATP-binding protein
MLAEERASAVTGRFDVRFPARLEIVEPRPSEETEPVLVEMRNVSKIFSLNGGDPFTGLSGISLRLGAGAAALVRGPSGSGKTTLLSLVGCMTRPTFGRIELAGRDVTRLPEDELSLLRRSNIGFVFQGNHLVRGVSALVNVMLPGIPSPEKDGNLRGEAEALLARFGLENKVHERVERLSGGEQQRVAIARALIGDPQIFLADEPTAHLDREATVRFLDFLGQLQEEGKTVLVVSHDASLCQVSAFSDVFELSQGYLRRAI